ncbi:hypothetical protein [Candidatus Contubernalis alkaliaceticus]|uniref:hypothetical protein n=1 Tax=Candidatus Contubernalis alkaliaceticus TaxID=338645 RepID=UPI001F4C07CE|nr:hypothetical protein [Candidatus Contubernalis alkalaceticus]UNC92734.1 hypothetical protein HUE98_11875 [Candidatus Contubernalis alkalaceticus]
MGSEKNKLIQVYSIDTQSFYSKEEEKVNKRKIWFEIKRRTLEEYLLFTYLCLDDFDFNNICQFYRNKFYIVNKDGKKIRFRNKHFRKQVNKCFKDNKETFKSKEFQKLLKENVLYKNYQQEITKLKKELNELLNQNKKTRSLNPEKVSKYNIVGMFDGSLTRTLNLDYSKLTKDIMIVRVYHYPVMEQIIDDGFLYNNEKYIFYTASAGQIRTKKIVMIKESVFKEYQKSLMCGLTDKNINKSGGCNINKYLSYLALNNSATNKWENFNIDKAIVIEDFKTTVTGEVDYIDNKTFKSESKPMDIEIEHSDGCGWILASESTKTFMVRLPWIKGILTPVDYLEYCKEENEGNYKVTDIYGKEWDLKEDNIKYVFSKSQFKMSGFYENWQDYKDKFKLYNCHASICNVEPDNFKNKSFNYQMWQTLTDMTDDEIKKFTDPIDKKITNAYTKKETMLDILGASIKNENKNYLQEALSIYPELLNDNHVKHKLSGIINSTKKKSKYGKFSINAKNTYIIPDVYAWMQYSLGNIDNPEGLLENGQVSCKLYKNNNELLVNRSPHLYREHAVRDNVFSKDINKWFTTNGIYTSCHDLISKMLQFDVDGDTSLVVADSTLIKVAKRNMKGVLPLYYEMGSAEPQIINNKNIINSLKLAFKYSNIGKYSNALSVGWNCESIDLDLLKAITALNNFSIDAAKTLEMPEIEGEMASKIKLHNLKMPYFFRFAKDKDNVSKINDSTVNRICKNIEDIKQGDFDFSGTGKFRYDKLINNKKIEIDGRVINEYMRMKEESQKYFFNEDSAKKEEIGIAVWSIMKDEFSLFCESINVKLEDAVDMIIKYIYKSNKKERDGRKELLFKVFGDVIVENLTKNLNGTIMCNCCGARAKKKSNRQKMCPGCAEKINRLNAKLRKKKTA